MIVSRTVPGVGFAIIILISQSFPKQAAACNVSIRDAAMPCIGRMLRRFTLWKKEAAHSCTSLFIA